MDSVSRGGRGRGEEHAVGIDPRESCPLPGRSGVVFRSRWDRFPKCGVAPRAAAELSARGCSVDKGGTGSDCRTAGGANQVPAGAALIAQTQRATAAGVKGVTPCRRRRFDEEPWQTTDVPICSTSVEDSPTPHRLLCNPRGMVRGHPARCPRLDTRSFRLIETRRASGGRRGVAPLHSPPGCPWTRSAGQTPWTPDDSTS